MNSGITVLIVTQSHPYLGACPDGSVHDLHDVSHPNEFLEIVCPYSGIRHHQVFDAVLYMVKAIFLCHSLGEIIRMLHKFKGDRLCVFTNKGIGCRKKYVR